MHPMEAKAPKSYPKANFAPYRPSRNPYAAKIAAAQSTEGGPRILMDGATEERRGKWREAFGLAPGARLELELGAYHGETSHALAKRNPEGLVLGVEWKFKQAFKAAKKAQDQRLDNVCFLRANMARLPWMFAPGEIDRVWMLFPDPWSKERQQKHRLLQPGFLRMLACLLPEGKEFLIKTDHPEYAAFIMLSLREAACFDFLPEARAKEAFAEIPPTPFERIFLRQNLPINSFGLVRNSLKVEAPEAVREVLHS